MTRINELDSLPSQVSSALLALQSGHCRLLSSVPLRRWEGKTESGGGWLLDTPSISFEWAVEAIFFEGRGRRRWAGRTRSLEAEINF